MSCETLLTVHAHRAADHTKMIALAVYLSFSYYAQTPASRSARVLLGISFLVIELKCWRRLVRLFQRFPNFFQRDPNLS